MHLEVEAERERKARDKGEALKAAEAPYLASDAFSIVKVDCFWERFEEFWDIAAERFSNIDFSSIKLREPKDEDEEEKEVGQGDIMLDEGVVEAWYND